MNNVLETILRILCVLAVMLPPLCILAAKSDNRIKYRTNFGYCPARVAGGLVLDLVKTFEQTTSLRTLKQRILEEKLDKKYFLSHYTITYDPFKGFLSFIFQCPKPLMKVQIYKEDHPSPYEAVLVDTGELYDAAYETMLKSEKKLKDDLPHLALPVGEMDEKAQVKITNLILSVESSFRKKISEIILAKNGDLTIIMSILGRPSSVFIGNDEWDQKMVKLQRLVEYVRKKHKVPVIINLVNPKKVVVKFNDKF